MLSQDEIDELIRAIEADRRAKFYPDDIEEILDLKEKIRGFTWRWSSLSPREKVELDLAESRLRDIQRSCGHVMERRTLFTTVRLICRKCDWEDKRYCYATDPNVKKKS